jgi:nucleoside-diphosphate-sugar epimerase
MNQFSTDENLVRNDELILITGAAGFIGSRVVDNLLGRGFRNLRCFTRSSQPSVHIQGLMKLYSGQASIEIFNGNLLSREDCQSAVRDVVLVYHLAAGRGEKSIPDAFLNSVVTTRNLLDAVVERKIVRRFVNVSSFAVYTNSGKRSKNLLEETAPLEEHPESRGAYEFAKLKQEQIVTEYSQRFGMPYVTVRPGYVYGPGNPVINGRVGLGTFGIFLHLGGSNKIPLTYVDNCADAIVMTGLRPGIEGQAFNIVDDDLPSSRKFLRLYKNHVRSFSSLYVPHFASYVLCSLWERYSKWSHNQLPPRFNRRAWHANWKKTRYSNAKLKKMVGWAPAVSTAEGLRRYFESCRNGEQHA